LGVALEGDLYCEFIADGIHVDPMVARMLARTKRHDRIVLITDAISATGMPDGQYQLGDLVVDVAHGQCRHNHALAGSVLTLDRAISNFAEFTGLGIRDTIAMATVNPARLLDNPLYGGLAVGRPAHLTVRAKDGRIMQTFIGGQPVLAI
jgi:N-acetylglucosamine-6-phosphate deacetylase